MSPPAPPPYLGINFTNSIHTSLYPSILPTTPPSTKSHSGKVLLLAGAGRGIGRATALSYAHTSLSKIYILSRTLSDLESLAAEITSINPSISVHAHAIDVTSVPAVSALADKIKTAEGRLDILILNAAFTSPWKPLPEPDFETYWRTFEVNLKAPLLFLHSFLPLMAQTGKETGEGTDVVVVSSIGALAVMRGASAYQVSKFGLLRVVEFVDCEFGGGGGKDGVRCFAIHPGAVKTGFTRNSVLEVLDSCNDDVDLCGGFCVWLTREDRGWLAGRYLSVNWDVDELLKMRGEIEGSDMLKMRMVM